MVEKTLEDLPTRDRARDFLARDPSLKEEIPAKIVQKSTCVFKLASLQLSAVLKEARPIDLRRRLHSLSDDIDQYYTDTLNRAFAPDRAFDHGFLKKVLTWLLNARSTVHEHELAFMIGIEGDSIEPGGFADVPVDNLDYYVACCEGLVIMRDGEDPGHKDFSEDESSEDDSYEFEVVGTSEADFQELRRRFGRPVEFAHDTAREFLSENGAMYGLGSVDTILGAKIAVLKYAPLFDCMPLIYDGDTWIYGRFSREKWWDSLRKGLEHTCDCVNEQGWINLIIFVADCAFEWPSYLDDRALSGQAYGETARSFLVECGLLEDCFLADICVKYDWRTALEWLVRGCVNPNVRPTGTLRVQQAIDRERTEMFDALLKLPALDVNARSEDNFTPLERVAQLDDDNRTHYYMQRLCDRDDIRIERDDNKYNVLHWACQSSAQKKPLALSKANKASINALAVGSWSGEPYPTAMAPLMVAAEHGNIDQVQLLVGHADTNPNEQAPDGSTVLIRLLRADQGHRTEKKTMSILELLLSRKDLDFDLRDCNGRNAVSWAAFGCAPLRSNDLDHVELLYVDADPLRRLITHKAADLFEPDDAGHSAIDYAQCAKEPVMTWIAELRMEESTTNSTLGIAPRRPQHSPFVPESPSSPSPFPPDPAPPRSSPTPSPPPSPESPSSTASFARYYSPAASSITRCTEFLGFYDEIIAILKDAGAEAKQKVTEETLRAAENKEQSRTRDWYLQNVSHAISRDGSRESLVVGDGET